jgi:hypothetical protein
VRLVHTLGVPVALRCASADTQAHSTDLSDAADRRQATTTAIAPIPLLGMVAKEDRMGFVGVLVTFAGFLLAAASVGISSSNGTRLGIVVVGIVISLIGIMGVINPAYQKNAVWKK